eukprot:TRINITY_DN1691_c0_g1_i5.p1 TRINITY_DN1691_c0_g1~~TRINITY_DN1691_c0_g1_i5.p1  ORF type:complete len:565 (+),score=161.67 TRINITY_DN1691_c0_g1_i5:66-1760(+)
MKCIPVLAVLVGLVNAEFLAKVHGAKKGAKGVYDINGFQMMVLDNMDEVGMMSTSGIQVEEAEDVTDKGYSFFTAPSLCGELDKDAQWGARSISGGSNYLAESYAFPQGGGGEGVVVYILDSGVSCNHAIFGGRCTIANTGGPTADTQGHGTHVAGIVAGISRKASIKSVRVSNTDNKITYQSLLKGVEWAIDDITAHGKPSVINLSLGGDRSDLFNKAIESFSTTTVVVTASGNKGVDACNISPGSASNAINVGNAMFGNNAYGPSSSSNWGQCVNLYAPGQFVSSASNVEPNTYVRKSGTSMAAPHVAGVAANYLAAGVTPSYNSMLSVLQETALKNVIKNPKSANASDSTLLHVPCAGAVRTTDNEFDCFGEFVTLNSSGSLKYPETGNYKNVEFRCWKVSCTGGIDMTYKTYDFEQGKDGIVTYVNGVKSDSYTGTSTSSRFVRYSQDEVVVQLLSDESVTGTGFTLEWQCGSSSSSTDYTVAIVVVVCVAVVGAVVVLYFFFCRGQGTTPGNDVEAQPAMAKQQGVVNVQAQQAPPVTQQTSSDPFNQQVSNEPAVEAV